LVARSTAPHTRQEPDASPLLALSTPALQCAERLRHARVVLHVDDQSVAELEDVRPFVPPSGPLGPREQDSDSPIAPFEPVNLQVVIAVSVSPLDL
jgi:hypothetical protein